MTTAWWTASHLFLPCSWSMDAFCFCAALHILEFIKDFLRLVDILRILHFFPPDWFMNCDYFKSFNDDFLCQLPKKKQNERALKAISWLRKKKISVVSSNLLSMLYSREIQIKTREKWLEAKQSIKCIEYLKYFEVYGCGRIRKSIFIVFATSEKIYQRIRRKKIKKFFCWLDAAAKYEFMMSLVRLIISQRLEIIDCFSMEKKYLNSQRNLNINFLRILRSYLPHRSRFQPRPL